MQGLLFAALAAGLALIAVAALRGGAAPIGVAAGALAVWMAGLALRALRR
jgi:hypothetical protein